MEATHGDCAARVEALLARSAVLLQRGASLKADSDRALAQARTLSSLVEDLPRSLPGEPLHARTSAGAVDRSLLGRGSPDRLPDLVVTPAAPRAIRARVVLRELEPGHCTERYAKSWELMIMVPLAGPRIAVAILWRGAVLRAWGPPAGTA
jgi:hypothetical protein